MRLRHSPLPWDRRGRVRWKPGRTLNADLAASGDCGAHNGALCGSQPFRRMYLQGHGAPGNVRRGAWGNPAEWEVRKALGASPPKRGTLGCRDEHFFRAEKFPFPILIADRIPPRLLSSPHPRELEFCIPRGKSPPLLRLRVSCLPVAHSSERGVFHFCIAALAGRRRRATRCLPASTSSAAFLIGFPAAGLPLHHIHPVPPVPTTCGQRLDFPSRKRHRLRSRRLLTRPPQA
jgi:hypothetical protein